MRRSWQWNSFAMNVVMLYLSLMHILLHTILSLILAWNISGAIPAFLPRRFQQRWADAAGTVMLCLICLFPIIPAFSATYMISFLLFCAYIALFYRDRKEKAAAFAVIFFSVIGSWSYLSSIWIRYLAERSLPAWMPISIASLLIILAILYFSIFRTYSRQVSESMLLEHFTKRLWGYATVIALTPSMLILALVLNPHENVLLQQLMTFFAMISSTVIFPLLYQMGRSAKLSEENSRLKASAEYYRDVEAQQEEIRKMKHDLMNHFTVIATYLDLGENGKAIGYLKEIGTEFSELTKQYTPSTMINAVLNSKRQKARNAGIELQIKADASTRINADSTDLCTLIANALDNAIEALPPDKVIAAEIADDGSTLYYSVTNRYEKAIQRGADGSFISSKSDRRNHGLGIKNIREAVSRLGGKVDITAEDGIFRLYAEVPLPR